MQHCTSRANDLPRLSGPPTKRVACPYGVIGHRHRCGRLKFEAIKVSQTQKGETTYCGHAWATQQCRNDSKHLHRVIGPRRQRGSIKIEPTKVKPVREVEMTYLECTRAAQPRGNPLKGCWEVHRPRRRCGHMKIASVNVKIEHINHKNAQKDETTYWIHAQLVQPLRNTLKRCCGVYRPIRHCGRIKMEPRNVSRTRNAGRTYLGRVVSLSE